MRDNFGVHVEGNDILFGLIRTQIEIVPRGGIYICFQFSHLYQYLCAPSFSYRESVQADLEIIPLTLGILGPPFYAFLFHA